jgi:hypothetical protein
MRHFAIQLFAVSALAVNAAWAQSDQAPAPAPSEAGKTAQSAPDTGANDAVAAEAEPVARVVAVEGNVRYRVAPDAEWQPLTTESALPEGSEVQSSLRSGATLQVGPNAEVQVDSLSSLIIGEVQTIEPANTVRTRLGMKYGNADFDVKQVGFTNDFQVATPSGVTAVAGTRLNVMAYQGLAVSGHRSNGMNAVRGTLNSGKQTTLTGDQTFSGNQPNPLAYRAQQLNTNLQKEVMVREGGPMNQKPLDVAPNTTKQRTMLAKWQAYQLNREVFQQLANETISQGGEGQIGIGGGSDGGQ